LVVQVDSWDGHALVFLDSIIAGQTHEVSQGELTWFVEGWITYHIYMIHVFE
jgi:hypothetical protein